MTKISLDILDDKRKEVFLRLKQFSSDGTLGGGTAIALQLKHRYSYDFDVFFEKPVTRNLFKKADNIFTIQEKLVDNQDQLTFLTKEGVKITFLFYPFFPLHSKIKINSISLFHLKDLASDKAATIGRRGAWRDYVDVFFLLKNRIVDLKTLIKETKKRFGAEFAPKLFLEQLTYYEDIADFKIDFIGESYLPKEIQGFFKKTVISFKKLHF